MNATKEQDWWTDHGEVLAFARVLVDDGMLESARDALYFLEKPWKWTDERDRWVAAGRPDEFSFEAAALLKLDELLEEEEG